MNWYVMITWRLARKWKKVSNIKESHWTYEVGEAPQDP
jgi:hypothetical protein